MSSSIAQLSFSPQTDFEKINVFLISGKDQWPTTLLGEMPGWISTAWNDKKPLQWLSTKDKQVIVVQVDASKDFIGLEKIRKQGAETHALAKGAGWNKMVVWSEDVSSTDLLAFAEGAALSSYQFIKYKKSEKEGITEIILTSKALDEKQVSDLAVIVRAVAQTRDLVNEPVSYLTARKLSDAFQETGKQSGFEVEVLEKNKIESLKMGGLLGVNQGSDLPPTFNIMEYKPKSAKNKKPIVLVGKGVVYDTGGYSIKTSSGMEAMKCDMAGAATVLGVLRIISELQLPVHVIGLVPATDNQVSAKAMVPGDVITISDGTTVEVLNTDAEGRLILADALVFAQKYDPELVFDFATLTGAAARAIGKEGFVFMGTASEDIKIKLEVAQNQTYERGVEFPLWDEYDGYLKSDVADVKNIGGAEAGAITAGKFLQRFTKYPWIHFDIAGPAFYEGGSVGYIPKGGTAFGVRMVVEFLKKY